MHVNNNVNLSPGTGLNYLSLSETQSDSANIVNCVNVESCVNIVNCGNSGNYTCLVDYNTRGHIIHLQGLNYFQLLCTPYYLI